jgi:hypothetical protein
MPFLEFLPWLIGGTVATGAVVYAKSAGDSTGAAAGAGIGDAATIIGIAAGVGIIIYAVHKSGKRA